MTSDNKPAAAPGIDLHVPCTEAVYALARKLLWIAYAWNDHNFDHPYKIARALAQEFGIESFDQANAWLDEQSKLIDASPNGGIHPDDAAVDAFAAEMKAKLAEARAKGRGGWQNEEPSMQQRLSDMLRSHVEKGDPRDVANFCMFLHQRGEGISHKGGSTHSPGHNWCWECGRRPSDPLAFNCQARDFHMPATSAEVGA